MKEEDKILFDSDYALNYRNCVPDRNDDAMNPSFLDKVRDLSYAVGPLTINSQYRSPAWEYSRGRSGMSQHCKGLAVDIDCRNNSQRWIIILNAMRLRFHRILVYPTFIHLDDKAGCLNQLIWMQK